MDNEEDYKKLSDEIQSSENRLMISYYNLILNIDAKDDLYKL